jgi:ribosomal protein S19
MARSLWKGPFVDFSLIRVSHKLRQNLQGTYGFAGPAVNHVSKSSSEKKIQNHKEQSHIMETSKGSFGKAEYVDPTQQNQHIRDTVIIRPPEPYVPIKIWSRRSIILPEFLSQQFEIHNGKDFISLQVNEEMIGHKFGEFSSTRKKTIHKKKLTKK